MSKIIVFGSLVQDIFLTLSPEDFVESDEQNLVFQIGKKHHIKAIHYVVGGGGANMAVSLSRLGNNVHLHTAVGTDEVGSTLLSFIEHEHIAIQCVQRSSKKTGFSIIFPSRSGNQTIFSYTGAHHDLNAVSCDTNGYNALCIAPLHGNAVQNIATILQSKPKKAMVFVNPSVDQIIDPEKTVYHSLGLIDIVQCNYREALLFLQHTVEKEREDQVFLSSTNEKKLDLFFEFMHKHGVSIVIVTRGKEGVLVSHYGARYLLEMPVVSVKNTVGAGDAFGSTFLHVFLKTKSIAESLLMAATNVVAVLQSSDAQAGLLSYETLNQNVQDIRNRIHIKKTG